MSIVSIPVGRKHFIVIFAFVFVVFSCFFLSSLYHLGMSEAARAHKSAIKTREAFYASVNKEKNTQIEGNPDFSDGKYYHAVVMFSQNLNSEPVPIMAKITEGKYVGASVYGEALFDPEGMVLLKFEKFCFNNKEYSINALGFGPLKNESPLTFTTLETAKISGLNITILMI